MEGHSDIARRWLKRTERALLEEMERLKVQDTEALRRGLSSSVEERGEGTVVARLRFLTRGRFVDMGVGRRAKLDALSRRRAKQWYSRPFYGRLAMLHGAVGLELMEESMSALKRMEDGKGG